MILFFFSISKFAKIKPIHRNRNRYRSHILRKYGMLGGRVSVKWRENTSRPGEVERAGMDATEYTYGAKQTDAAIRAVASRYRDRRAATSRDNDNKLSPSLSRSRLRPPPHPSPAHTYPRSARVYCATVARARGDSSLQRSEQHLCSSPLDLREILPRIKWNFIDNARDITFDSPFFETILPSFLSPSLFLASLIFFLLPFVIFLFQNINIRISWIFLNRKCCKIFSQRERKIGGRKRKKL